MVCLLAGTRFTKSLVLFGGWQAACRLDCYKIQLSTRRTASILVTMEHDRKPKDQEVHYGSVAAQPSAIVLATPHM
jgi:hypothetical protein